VHCSRCEWVSHTLVPFKVRVETEEGAENPVHNTEDVCVLCEVGTEAKNSWARARKNKAQPDAFCGLV